MKDLVCPLCGRTDCDGGYSFTHCQSDEFGYASDVSEPMEKQLQLIAGCAMATRRVVQNIMARYGEDRRAEATPELREAVDWMEGYIRTRIALIELEWQDMETDDDAASDDEENRDNPVDAA